MVRRLVHPRFAVVALAPLVALASLSAHTSAQTAQAKQLIFAWFWDPPLTGYHTLAGSLGSLASDRSTISVMVRTSWVDTRAVQDSPNIVQQGRYGDRVQVKLQIRKGAAPSDHRGQCRVAGLGGGSVLATGPAIDIADGGWHTVTCTKLPDAGGRTGVFVTVDGIVGPTARSSRVIGSTPGSVIDLGGRSAVPSSDSLYGEISALSKWLGG